MDLAMKLKEHAEKYLKLNLGEVVEKLEAFEDHIKVTTSNQSYDVGAAIIATGTVYKKLGIKGEGELSGRGVSYCATCDGPFFKGKKVIVVGGGNSALVEAIALQDMGTEVTLVHRRDKLRAEQTYQDKAKEMNLNIVYDAVVEEIVGKDKVEGVKIKDCSCDATKDIEAEAVFISVGEIPKNELAAQIGVELDEKGYIKTDRNMRTNIKRVYAAGDITGGLRQIVTACAEGAIAALTSTEVLGKVYPY
jgi:thioredoxin reductase (NADPH)